MPSHWSGQDEVLIVAKTRGGRGTRARHAPPPERIQYEQPWKWAHGHRGLTRMSAADMKEQHSGTSLALAEATEEAERHRREQGLRRREETRRQHAVTRELSRRRAEQLGAPFILHQQAVERRQGRLRLEVEKRLGVSKSVAGFSVPLGATINMDGTALYEVTKSSIKIPI